MRPDAPFRHLTASRQLSRRRRRNIEAGDARESRRKWEKKWGKASWKTDEGVNERKRREVFLSAALSCRRRLRGVVSFKIVSSRELVRAKAHDQLGWFTISRSLSMASLARTSSSLPYLRKFRRFRLEARKRLSNIVFYCVTLGIPAVLNNARVIF